MKATKLETAKRVQEIQDWIIEGKPDYIILKDIIGSYKVGIRQAKNLFKKASDLWLDATKIEIDKKRLMKVDQLKNRMTLMSEKYQKTPQGLRVLLAYDKHIDKLEGIIPEKTIKLKGDEEFPIVVTNSKEREARIAALIAKATLADKKI